MECSDFQSHFTDFFALHKELRGLRCNTTITSRSSDVSIRIVVHQCCSTNTFSPEQLPFTPNCVTRGYSAINQCERGCGARGPHVHTWTNCWTPSATMRGSWGRIRRSLPRGPPPCRTSEGRGPQMLRAGQATHKSLLFFLSLSSFLTAKSYVIID